MGRVSSTTVGRLTLKAETNEIKINRDKWVLEERQSEDCFGNSDQDRKEFRAMREQWLKELELQAGEKIAQENMTSFSGTRNTNGMWNRD